MSAKHPNVSLGELADRLAELADSYEQRAAALRDAVVALNGVVAAAGEYTYEQREAAVKPKAIDRHGQVVQLLADYKPSTAVELSRELGLRGTSQIHGILKRMAAKGLVAKRDDGRWELA